MARSHHINGLFARVSAADFRKHFTSMLPLSLHAYIALDIAYWKNGRENPMSIPQRWLADEIGCDPKTASKVIAELREHGFLHDVRKGKLMGGPRSSRSSWYRLAWQAEKTDEGNFPSSTRENMERTRGSISLVGNSPNASAIKASKSIAANDLSVPAPVAFEGAA